MPGKINCVRVNQSIVSKWNASYTEVRYKTDVSNLNKDDSYIAIFSRYQQRQLDALKSSDEVNILWISDRAVNPVHSSNGPSNTVVIFEVK
jgi:hypothetical protein